MPTLIPGLVITPVSREEEGTCVHLVDEPHLILLANANLDKVVLIPITARRSAGRIYFRGPKTLSYGKLAKQLDSSCPLLTLQQFVPRSETNLTDEELNRKYKRKGQLESIALAELKWRWGLLRPLIDSDDRELLFDAECRLTLLRARANELLVEDCVKARLDKRRAAAKAKKPQPDEGAEGSLLEGMIAELQRLLCQFWAGGSVRGALIGFSGAKGGKGKPKKAGEAKRGRRNAKQAEGRVGESGINVEDGSADAKIIKFCHDTWVVRGTTVGMALRRMWTDFYSETVQLSDGSTKRQWLPVWKRPTLAQFIYWGTKEDAAAVAWRKHLPPTKFDKSYRAVMGSVTDDVFAIGQRGGIDSTPPDVQLVRAIDNVARVGGGHRVIVVDAMFGYIPGLYMGFTPPSSSTVRLALFNAADPDKRSWLDDLSLNDVSHEDWVPILFQNLFADNTDLRTQEVMRCAESVGTNIHFVPKMRSDLNALPESGHHVLHRLVDHKLSGTTFGRPNQRGEVSATDRARLTMMEAIRETVRAIHFHNTAEIKDNRPLRTRFKGIAPTRLAQTQELIRVGKVARALHAVDLLRRQLLPRHRGTFTAGGVRLHRTNAAGKVEFIGHIIYVSKHPIIARRCEEARRGGKLDPDYFRGEFIVNPYAPRRIWHLDLGTGEAIELDLKVLVVRDPDLPYVMSLQDMVDRDAVEASEGIDLADSRARALGAIEAKQRECNEQAEQRYEAAVEQAGGEPPKSVFRRDKRDNRDKETSTAMLGVPLAPAALGGERTQKNAQESEKDSPPSEVDRAHSDAKEPASDPVGRSPRRSLRQSLLRAAAAKLIEPLG